MVAKLIALVLPLGLDTFAVAAALGLTRISRARRRQITLLFTGFEAGMPLIGLAIGAPLGHAIGRSADYPAIAVLILFGLYVLLAPEDEQRIENLATAHGARWIALGISISIDELAIGFTLGLLRLPTLLVIILIALQTIAVTQLGLRLGNRLSDALRERAEQVAGAALIILGLVLLAEKILASS